MLSLLLVSAVCLTCSPPNLIQMAIKYSILCRIQRGLIHFVVSVTRSYDPLRDIVSLDLSRLCGGSRTEGDFFRPNEKHTYTF